MLEARIIKKYPNRRLYDTEESRYITLADVRSLVLNDVDFVVIDKKTGDDLTRNILLQVISEGEQQGAAIMSRVFLSHVIRAHGHGRAAGAATYLEQCLDAYVTRQAGAHGPVPFAEIAQVRRGRRVAAPDSGQRCDVSEDADRSVPRDRKKAG